VLFVTHYKKYVDHYFLWIFLIPYWRKSSDRMTHIFNFEVYRTKDCSPAVGLTAIQEKLVLK